MTPIEQIVSVLRNLINQYSDDTNYTDEFLYSLYKDARATILEDSYDKFEAAPQTEWFNFCMPMCVDVNHICKDCVPVGCTVLKSKYKLPAYLTGRNKELIEVMTLNGTSMSKSSFEDWKELIPLSEIKKSKLFFEIKNDYLYIYGGNTSLPSPKVVEISLVPEDILDLTLIPYCTRNGETNNTCFDIYQQSVRMRAAYNMKAYDYILKVLNLKYRYPVDKTNDNDSGIIPTS